MWSIAFSVFVVCLSVCSQISKITCASFTKCSARFTCGHGLVLLLWWCNILCTFIFVIEWGQWARIKHNVMFWQAHQVAVSEAKLFLMIAGLFVLEIFPVKQLCTKRCSGSGHGCGSASAKRGIARAYWKFVQLLDHCSVVDGMTCFHELILSDLIGGHNHGLAMMGGWQNIAECQACHWSDSRKHLYSSPWCNWAVSSSVQSVWFSCLPLSLYKLGNMDIWSTFLILQKIPTWHIATFDHWNTRTYKVWRHFSFSLVCVVMVNECVTGNDIWLEWPMRVEHKCDCVVHVICMLSADTKDQWARDDPAFLVLLTFWLFGNLTSVMFCVPVVTCEIVIFHLQMDVLCQSHFTLPVLKWHHKTVNDATLHSFFDCKE